MARIAIVGVGAIGGAIAGLLETAGGHEITLCTRRPLQQLTVTMAADCVQVKARNVTAPENAGPADWVLVATKAYDAAGAAEWFPALCAQGAPVAILQNGVEHRERFAPYMEQARLMATYTCADPRSCAYRKCGWASSLARSSRGAPRKWMR